MITLMYLAIIGLWGFTWFAIKNQLGIVPIEISLIYRFALAALVLFFIILFKRISFRFSFKQHIYMALLGSLLFSINFFFVYNGSKYLTSGISAIIFSTSVIMIMFNSAFFLKKNISLNMILGSLSGLLGLSCIFWSDLQDFNLTNESFLGLTLTLIGTYCFSWANQVSNYCSRLSIPLISSTFYGMLYGVLFLNIFCLFTGISYQIDTSFAYLASLLYLAIPGSVIGFLVYLALVNKLGAEKAVYTTLFFPIVALIVSTFFEDFTWVVEDFIGILMILFGNALMLRRQPLVKPSFK